MRIYKELTQFATDEGKQTAIDKAERWRDVLEEIIEVVDGYEDDILIALREIRLFLSEITRTEPKVYKNPALRDVHTSHCCERHKHCKYSKEETECTVCLGIAPAEYDCNCEWM